MCYLSDAKGQHVALADAHEGMGAGLQRGTQPSGTHHGNGGLMEQVGTTGGYGYGVGAHLARIPLFSPSAGGALDQAVEDVDPPFGSRASLHEDFIGKQLRQGRKRGETWGGGRLG